MSAKRFSTRYSAVFVSANNAIFSRNGKIWQRGARNNLFDREYDVVVVGAGVAGIHAAFAAASKHASVLLITSSWDTVAGLAWGPCFSDSDLRADRNLRGWPRETIKRAAIGLERAGSLHYGLSRAFLVDSFRYQGIWKHRLETLPGVTVFQDTCEGLFIDRQEWTLHTSWGARPRAKTAIISVGTFLDGRVKYGDVDQRGGRPGEVGSDKLAGSLFALDVKFQPEVRHAAPIVAAKSINWDKAKSSPVYLYPTSNECELIYVRSLEKGQDVADRGGQSLKKINGLEKAEIVSPAFSTSFMTIPDIDLTPTMAWRNRPSLFFAGQVAGAGTYLESVEQGLRAGMSAASLSSVSRET